VKKLTSAIVKEIRQAYLAGVPQTDLGRRYGLNKSTLTDICRNRSWKDPSFKPRRHGHCKFDDQAVEAAIQKFVQGVPDEELSRELGAHLGYVRKRAYHKYPELRVVKITDHSLRSFAGNAHF
jgi:hypothetical protein